MHPSEQMDERHGERRGLDMAEKVFILGLLGLIAAPALKRWFKASRTHSRPIPGHAESSIDKTIADSYPASDPPASRQFDIPVNRQ